MENDLATIEIVVLARPENRCRRWGVCRAQGRFVLDGIWYACGRHLVYLIREMAGA